jgi:hypothetical protein
MATMLRWRILNDPILVSYAEAASTEDELLHGRDAIPKVPRFKITSERLVGFFILSFAFHYFIHFHMSGYA